MAEETDQVAPEEMEAAPEEEMQAEPEMEEPEEPVMEYKKPGAMVHGWWAQGPTERQMINLGMKAMKRANARGRKPGTPLTPELQRAFGIKG
jgi:hypothetical protein